MIKFLGWYLWVPCMLCTVALCASRHGQTRPALFPYLAIFTFATGHLSDSLNPLTAVTSIGCALIGLYFLLEEREETRWLDRPFDPDGETNMAFLAGEGREIWNIPLCVAEDLVKALGFFPHLHMIRHFMEPARHRELTQAESIEWRRITILDFARKQRIQWSEESREALGILNE